jgi:hypothetical protein
LILPFTKSSIEFHQGYVEELIEKKIAIQKELERIYPKIKQAKKAGGQSNNTVIRFIHFVIVNS